MIVAVLAMGSVEVPADQIVAVVSVRDRFVAAAAAVLVTVGVLAAGVLRSAGGRVLACRLELALVDVPLVAVVEVTVVQVVRVVGVLDSAMAAGRAVHMLMTIVRRVAHGSCSFRSPDALVAGKAQSGIVGMGRPRRRA
jgi:hypothetical protein